ncbi:MAG: hypothetical protein QG594_98, partial [Bacteroidota bacterium]|nr:hypothetical protein [Bacteroidota bacterium]
MEEKIKPTSKYRWTVC